jgi:predicted GNAT superfamily acetyltransferase
MAALAIRPARRADIPAIATINLAGRPGLAPLTPENAAEALRLASYFVLAELADQVVGYLIGYTSEARYEGDEFVWFRSRFDRFLYVDQVAVAPTHRRAGIGAQLYGRAAAHADAHGLPALVCEVNLDPPNPASLAFHARLGFREVGILTIPDGRTVSLQLKELLSSDHLNTRGRLTREPDRFS